MSMHKIPLTDLERSGLEKHGLAIGTPSQLSDAFRQGVKHALVTLAAQEPVGYAYENQDFIGSVIGAKGDWAPSEIPLYLAAGAAPVQVGDCNTCVYETRSFASEPCVTCSRLRDYTYNYVPKEPT